MKYSLEVTAFLAGASVMAIEIVASRIMAPFLGNSIVVWTSLIGVILAALSCGYWQGGRLADRNPSVGLLSVILAVAATLTAFIALSKNFFLTVTSGIPDVRAAAIVAELLLFAPVSFVLAMVSPYVLRLKLKDVKSSGLTAGQLNAISTGGSIFGTFGAGFFLLAIIGNTAILLCISALLFLASSLLSLSAFRKTRMALGLAALCAMNAPATSAPFVQSRLFETDTHYSHCIVTQGIDGATGRPIHSLITDRSATQSSAFIDRDDDVVLEYLKYFRLGRHFYPNARNTLLLGGGAFTFVQDFFRAKPTGDLDVVELDPRLVDIAHQYFGLISDPRLTIFNDDARPFLNRNHKTYDLIYVDTFASKTLVPHYLTTQETARRIYHSLSAQGVVLMNVVSAVDGPRSQFFRAELATYRTVFPRVEVFPLPGAPDEIRNLILVGFKTTAEPKWTSDDARMQEVLSHRYTSEIPNDAPVLTDDFAPVEVYLVKAYRVTKSH